MGLFMSPFSLPQSLSLLSSFIFCLLSSPFYSLILSAVIFFSAIAICTTIFFLFSSLPSNEYFAQPSTVALKWIYLLFLLFTYSFTLCYLSRRVCLVAVTVVCIKEFKSYKFHPFFYLPFFRPFFYPSFLPSFHPSFLSSFPFVGSAQCVIAVFGIPIGQLIIKC